MRRRCRGPFECLSLVVDEDSSLGDLWHDRPGHELTYLLTCMTRVLHTRNYGVYVADERRGQHHSPHCHVKHRGHRIASIHIVSLEMFIEIEPVPPDVMALIVENQDALISEWERLNS